MDFDDLQQFEISSKNLWGYHNFSMWVCKCIHFSKKIVYLIIVSSKQQVK